MIVFFKYGYSKISRVFIALLWVLSLTWVFFCSPSYAQTFFSQPRLFEVEQACEAVSSIRRQTSPVTIDSGEVLTVFGENKIPGGTHAFIRIDGQQKWFPLRCGR